MRDRAGIDVGPDGPRGTLAHIDVDEVARHVAGAGQSDLILDPSSPRPPEDPSVTAGRIPADGNDHTAGAERRDLGEIDGRRRGRAAVLPAGLVIRLSGDGYESCES